MRPDSPPPDQSALGGAHHPSYLLWVAVGAERTLVRKADLGLTLAVRVYVDLDYRLERASSFITLCPPPEEFFSNALGHVSHETTKAV